MNKIETSLDKVYQDVAAFYKYDKHHFIVMNAIDMSDKMEIQWFFHDYENPANVTMFQAFCTATETIPSITSLVASAWVAESELADLLGLNIENAKKGFVLEPDSKQSPLRKKQK